MVSVGPNWSSSFVDRSTWVNLPEGMGDDYVVYVNDVNNPTAINGFRTGMNWYNSVGTPVEDPKAIS